MSTASKTYTDAKIDEWIASMDASGFGDAKWRRAARHVLKIAIQLRHERDEARKNYENSMLVREKNAALFELHNAIEREMNEKLSEARRLRHACSDCGTPLDETRCTGCIERQEQDDADDHAERDSFFRGAR